MEPRLLTEVRSIHPRALKELGDEACIVALGVALDLRSGAIPRHMYEQWRLINEPCDCGTPCCILGHIRVRLNNYEFVGVYKDAWCDSGALLDLFSATHLSDPYLAADAIERYIYDGADKPWRTWK
jgi:hypothetical protein